MPVRDAAVVLRADLRFDLASSKLRPVVSARGRLPADVPLSQAIAAGSAATQRRPLDAEEPLASAVPQRTDDDLSGCTAGNDAPRSGRRGRFRLQPAAPGAADVQRQGRHEGHRSEEHTSELQSLMRISYAVFC